MKHSFGKQRLAIGLRCTIAIANAMFVFGHTASGQVEDNPLDRGRAALLGQSHIDTMWAADAYDNAWKVWGLDEKPADYDAAFRARYGLHVAPYENDGLPMGLRRAEGNDGPGVAIDCMVCHGGSILGKSYVGLPNTTVDLPLLFEEMSRASGRTPTPWPFELARSRGTTNAGAVSALVLAFRNPDLSKRVVPVPTGWGSMADLDAPAWWLWKRKETIYCDGGTDARSVRSTMQFVIAGSDGERVKALEPLWEDVTAYIRSIEPPQYPLEIDRELAAQGEEVFLDNCARCHGTYGPDGEYPNKIVSLEVIGTDRTRYDGVREGFREYYDKTWLAEKYPSAETDGYQAPPLDGIWATAPYLHNGSVPTVYAMLKSSERPKRFRRLPTTGAEAYDPVKLGWKVKVLDANNATSEELSPIEQRRVFDTSQFGKSNAGHPFGDKLTEEQRMAVIEYLKTL